MNFNQMDLIKLKEHFYQNRDSIEFRAISSFISKLVDLNFEKHLVENLLGKQFTDKQDLINLAYKLGNK